MTKKDYELIAWAIADMSDTYEGEDWTFDGALGVMTWKMADALQATNPRFNRELFLNACKVK